MNVAILGGGISGLSLGEALGAEGVSCVIFESAPVAGGLCRSETHGGYTMDRAGGHILYSKNGEVRSYWDELFADESLVASERHTRILYQDRFVAYPFENGLGDLPLEANFDCIRGYIEASLARRMGAPRPDNFGEWIHWRMGDGIARHFMVPYNEKIWKVALREMGISWVDGRVPDAPIDDVLRASLGIRTVGYAHQAHFQYPRIGGFQALTDRIADRVKAMLRLATPVAEVRRQGEQFLVNGEPFDLVVSTIPLDLLPDVVEDLDAPTREVCRRLRYRGVASVLFGIPAESALPYSWIYLPFPEQGAANRVTCLSNYSPGNAPKGRGSVLAEVTYEDDLDLSRSFLDDLEQALASGGFFPAGSVDFRHFAKNRHAYILFDRDFEAKRRSAVDGIESYGILPLGRFGRYNYYNSDHCLIDAWKMAAQIAGMSRTGSPVRRDGSPG